MKEQNEHHSFTGMQRDIAISKNPSGFMYDARNIRITQREDDTLIAITNERGTVDLNKFIAGKYLGHCLLNNWLVVFSKDILFGETASQQSGPDYITRFDLSSQDYTKVVLFAGNLTFDVNHPIEAIGSYENDSVQKVYWTDGCNQPRIINITPERIGTPHAESSFYGPEDSTTFDFVREVDLNAEVSVRKILGASGIFPGGVIQYAFTYYDKFGQESNIFYTTPLLYTSYNDRGVSPEDKVDNAFEITIENPDLKFDFVRIYSIMRTSENGTPICKRVQDLDIGILRTPGNTDTSLTFIDTNTTGEIIDPTELLYKGGEEITAQTIEQKDGTLFLGNINITRPNVRNVDFSGTDVVETAVQAAQAVEAVRIVQKVLETSSPRRSRSMGSSSHSADLIDDAAVVDIVGRADKELIINNKAAVAIANTAESTYVITSNNPDVDNSTTVVVNEDNYDVDDTVSVVVSADGDYSVDDSVIVSRNDKDYDVVVGGYVISVAHDGDIPLIDGGYIIDVDNGNNTGSTGGLVVDGQDVHYENGGLTVRCAQRHLYFPESEDTTYIYNNQLTGYSDEGLTKSSSCAGFKRGDYYRLGCQFQYKNGKWSEPVFIGDMQELDAPSFTVRSGNHPAHVTLPTFIGTLNASISETLYNMGYRKVRSVVVFPEMYDRVTLCQCVNNPTVYQNSRRYLNPTAQTVELKGVGDLWAQSSWFFRPHKKASKDYINSVAASPKDENELPYTSNSANAQGAPTWSQLATLRSVEIQGQYETQNLFRVDRGLCTLHSPDIEFDDRLWLYDFTNTNIKYRCVGRVSFSKTMSDIDIQTKSATISSDGGGFKHMISTRPGSYGWISGLFWDDYIVDDTKKDGIPFGAYGKEWSPCKWLVYPWNRTGSLNNDINRPIDKGTRSSELEKKVISNLRYAETIFSTNISEGTYSPFTTSNYPKIFNSDQLSILKFGNHIYQGNIDTLLVPDESEGLYFAFDKMPTLNAPKALSTSNINTLFTSDILWKTWNFEETDEHNVTTKKHGIYFYWDNPPSGLNPGWFRYTDDLGDVYPELGSNREFVRMKYKTTPHMVAGIAEGNPYPWNEDFTLSIFEIIVGGDTAGSLYRSTMFGGVSKDAFQANTWLPCGEPVALSHDGQTPVEFNFWYGDTYYQRWDCLKTYPFTKEDINQIVEIGSFMLETHVNIDGRYDRNRGQLDNTNMSPINFNLMNPVYSQLNNFYSYKILDSKFYLNNSFPNQVTWTKEKQAGADIDLWTNITLASTYDMDGSKGEVISLNTWKDSIFCFQNKGISNILFNSRVQIPTSDGVPIEISNSYKVDGYRYITDGTGCVNKWSIRETPAGIYFIDSVTNDLYHIGEGLTDVSLTHNMQTWFKDNTIDRTLYDDVHHDIYLVNDTEALCYSEILGQFTSFMDYGGMFLLESSGREVFSMHKGIKTQDITTLFKMFKGSYNDLFGAYDNMGRYQQNFKPWHITFISNGLDNKDMDSDKIFTNMDYRMDMFSDGEYEPEESFNTIRVWNEYQDTGNVTLKHPVVIGSPASYNLAEMNLEKKFRIWRIQIPRDSTRILDRIRNPWCKITLERSALDSKKAVLQDLNVQYFV